MSVADILKDRMALSFEVFPPKTDVGMEKRCGEGGVLDHLYAFNKYEDVTRLVKESGIVDLI